VFAGVPFPSTVVPEQSLATMRGGLEIAGLKMDLTAQLRTYIDQQLALATEVRLERHAAGANKYTTRLHTINQKQRDVEQGASAPVQLTTTTGTSPRQVFEVNVPGSDSPSALTPVGGVTNVTHVVSADQLISSVSNTADGRTVEQTLTVQVQVLNFRAFSDQARSAIRAQEVGRMFTR
ncbi:MAG TPA: hypothetical protein VLN90_04345, partial [Thioalkalivibrio sp.]|nr:hypothetical protein [Thioalkalivibrio sp.]